METKAEDAAKVLQKEAEERRTACGNELSAVLQKYNCTLEAQVLLSSKGVQTSVIVVAGAVRVNE